MFGLGGDMMKKLQDMQQSVEETKKRLDTVLVTGEAQGVIVTANGNRKVTEIKIDDALLENDKEDIEDLLLIAVNRAIEKADNVNESEMKGAASGLLGGIPGL